MKEKVNSEETSTSVKANEKYEELQELYLRNLAEMENLRNRTKREVEAAHQFGIQKFVKDLVPVADVLETAISQTKANFDQTKKDESKMQSILQGMEMTLEELKKGLNKHGVTVIDPMHQKFDPNYHLALVEVERSDMEPGTIVYVEKKGYLLHGRVIRAATVAISK